MSGPPQLVHAAPQDPFAYYKAFMHASMPPASHMRARVLDDDGHDSYRGVIGAYDNPDAGIQQQASARAVPYNIAIRLANRSNGAPLTTIIEQGSYSTLNSYGSLLSLAQYASERVAENIPPNRAPHRVSQHQEEHSLQRIQEHASQEQDVNEGVHENRGPYPPNHTLTPTESNLFHLSQRSGAQIDDASYGLNSRRFKSFLHGFLQNVRTSSRTRSRSSSTTHTTIFDLGEAGAETNESSSQIPIQDCRTSQMNKDKLDCPHPGQLSATSPEPQVRNRKVSETSPQPSARAYPPLLSLRPPEIELDTYFGSVPHLLSPSVATRSRERSSSGGLVQPEPRDAAHVDGTDGAPTLSNENSHDTSAPYTLDGVSVPPRALIDVNRARETSRNASFCSTMSTSYSGTILGVDVDLNHEFTHPVCRSRSPTPVAPVWFTPQKAGFERQSSCSESPEAREIREIKPSCRSMTSPALASLLPIAAASGIVRPNYDTPKISFFSPSGNLIQSDGDSTPRASASDFRELTTILTPSQNVKTRFPHNALLATGYLPPARPSLMPMTTPPTSLAPLPAHLKHHHNYRHPERSQIDSYDKFTIHTSLVKGCDGVVRNNTSPHPSEIESPRHKRHCSTQSIIDDMKSEVNLHKAHIVTWASGSCMPPRERSRLRKRYPTSDDSIGTSKSEHNNGTNHTAKVIQPDRDPQDKQDKGLLGPFAGHALRICFCQPYDGAGKRTHTSSVNTLCLSRPTDRHETVNEEPIGRIKESEADLPAARVVDGNNGGKRKKHASNATKHARARSDSAVSVGVSFRVAIAGG